MIRQDYSSSWIIERICGHDRLYMTTMFKMAMKRATSKHTHNAESSSISATKDIEAGTNEGCLREKRSQLRRRSRTDDGFMKSSFALPIIKICYKIYNTTPTLFVNAKLIMSNAK